MSWQRELYEGFRPLLFAADAEWIHSATLTGLRIMAEGSYGRALLSHLAHDGPAGEWAGIRPVEHMGLRFRNPVGLAAGFDKHAEAVVAWGALGFGFAEVGTVTPLAQPGNPRPRLWRVPDDDALVNRMGFNNRGTDAIAQQLTRARPWLPPDFVIGVSIGRGAHTPDDAEEDYVAAARAVAPGADYLALNVSSPNTQGLAALQEPDRLTRLVTAVASVPPRRPVVVKLWPDLPAGQLTSIVEVLVATPAAGLVLSNTSRSRVGLRRTLPPGADQGGLSGRPLLSGMLAAIGTVKGLTKDRFTLIASGGIFSGADARRALDAGADLVQLWTGLVYAGPGLIGEVVEALTSGSS